MTTEANKASTLNDSEFRTLLVLLEAHTAATLSAARETPLPAIQSGAPADEVGNSGWAVRRPTIRKRQ